MNRAMTLACLRTSALPLIAVLAILFHQAAPVAKAQPPGVVTGAGAAGGPPGATRPEPIVSLRADTTLPDDASRHAVELSTELKFKRGWQNVIKPTLSLRHEQYDLDLGDDLGTTELPDQATHAELGLSLLRFTTSGWSFFARGELFGAAEDPDELADDINPLLLAAAGRQFANRNKLGFGLIAKQDIEEDWRVFPIPTFELHFANDWSLLSERGLLLQRALNEDPKRPATFGLGVDYLNSRFRAESGEVFEYNAAPVYLEWQQPVDEGLTLKARLGAVVWGEIERDDARGRGIEDADFDPGFHAAIQATWNFK